MTNKQVLITAALPYANADMHFGHVIGAYLPSDIYARYRRLQGDDIVTICGSDDYGVAIILSAEREGKSPGELAKYYHDRQQLALQGLGINFDIYSSTSVNPYHGPTAQEFFSSLEAKGEFKKRESEQFYDPEREMFLPDRFVKGTCAFCGTPEQNGDQCENCGKMLDAQTLLEPRSIFSGAPAVIKKTVHWYLDLSSHKQAVEEWLERATLREGTRAYVRGILDAGLVERSMTRDISWGIPVPLDDPDARGKVLYVWFDAPIGYISNTKELCVKRGQPAEAADRWWRNTETELFHFIGEDNTIFHTVVWIAMLDAEGSYCLPDGVLVNNFLNIKLPGRDEEKMSKSKRNAPEVLDYLENGGNIDALRYYISSILTERARGTYQPDALIQRYNTELADSFGNLVHRVVSFNNKHLGQAVPVPPSEKITPEDRSFETRRQDCYSRTTQLLGEFSFRAAIEEIMAFTRDANKYLDTRAPWTLRKSDPEAMAIPIFYALSAIHTCAIMLLPFIPHGASKVLEVIGEDANAVRWTDASQPLPEGHLLGTPQVIFPKIELVDGQLPIPYAPACLRD